MIRYILLLALVLNALLSIAQHTAKSFTIKKPGTNQNVNVGYLEHLPDDYYSTTQKYPLIIFLHGQGESGNGTLDHIFRVETNGTPKQIKLNQFPKSFTVNGKTYKFIVISPQLNTSEYGVSNWDSRYVTEIFNYVKKNYRIDPSRIYFTGLSLGGEGVWNYAGLESNIADSLTAIGVVCGSGGTNSYKASIIAKSNLPVWAFHGNDDVIAFPDVTRTWVNQINAIKPNLANMTIYPGVGHNAWDYAYSLSDNLNSTIEENMYIWFLKNQRVNLIEDNNPTPEPEVTVTTANDNIPAYTGQYRYGSNMGFYTSERSDFNIASLVNKVGGHTIRPSLPNWIFVDYNYDIRLDIFKKYQDELEMQDIAAFVGSPHETLRDKTKYQDSNIESQVFKDLYEPIWNSDGTVNVGNTYADYIYKTVIRYGPYVKFWEIWNEPDFTTSLAKKEEWLVRAPLAKELQNLQAPFYYYIRMMRISYEIIKKYSPNSYICTGGLGYTEFLDAMLRYTDNPNGGAVTSAYPHTGGAYFDILSFHFYPNYDLKKWNNPNNNFDYSYHSDAQVNRVIQEKNAFEKTLYDKGYNGLLYPKKLFIMTETGVAKKSFDIGKGDYRYGSVETQRNFVVKMDIQSQKNDIKQTYFYTLGDFGELNDANNDEFSLMGFYENLLRDNIPGTEKKTQSGIAHTTTSNLLYTFNYDKDKTQGLNLPSNVDGAAFTKGNETRYVLWTKTLNTEDEDENISYTFPSSLNIDKLNQYEWDFSSTQKFKTINSTIVNLTASPSFFTINDVVVIPDPDPNPNPDPGSGETNTYILFPNPSNKDVTIRITSKERGPGKYVIYNTMGKKLRNENFIKSEEILDISIDVRDFLTGVYIINLKYDNVAKPIALKMIKSDSVEFQ